MKINKLPEREYLRTRFEYRDDGSLIWKSNHRADLIGKPAGNFTHHFGYGQVTIDGKRYLLHRLIWAWHHGQPCGVIDHRDQDPTNNRIDNLQDITTAHNNRRKRRKLGAVQEKNGRYRAQISLGAFDSEDAARAAIRQAYETLGLPVD